MTLGEETSAKGLSLQREGGRDLQGMGGNQRRIR